MFAVWEPILPTDWNAPRTGALGRLNDRRVRQYWDPDHLVAAAIKKSEGSHRPDCCERKGFLWDLDAAYAPETRWSENLPVPALLNGPVVETTGDLDRLLGK